MRCGRQVINWCRDVKNLASVLASVSVSRFPDSAARGDKGIWLEKQTDKIQNRIE